MAQRAITKRSGISYYAICIVCIALMFLGGLIPPFAPEITKAGMQILCIYVALVFLWSSVGGVIWPSILAIVALGLTEFTTVGQRWYRSGTECKLADHDVYRPSPMGLP